jgi:DNA-binding transcriptional MocR family regulator
MFPYASIKLNRDGRAPLYRQLAEAIMGMIESGSLTPETKLPPIRALVKALNINAVTAVNAYKYLESRKHIYSVEGSGTYVSPLAVPAVPLVSASPAIWPASPDQAADMYNFSETAIDPAFFPVETFQRAFNIVLERDKGGAFTYRAQDSQGYEPLRETLCAHLESEYAVRVPVDQLQITSGAQQGLDILAKALLSPGDAILVEQPTFYGAVAAAASRGAQALDFPLESDGPDLERLAALIKIYHPKYMYIMPNFQTPTGISYSPEKKRGLLELAYQHEIWIIEEDSQNDFYYDDQRRAPLKALDYRNHVIYVKSFSKILMPGLRMGCIALPKKVNVSSVKWNTDIASPGFIQRTLDVYIRSGEFQKHSARMRAAYGKRYRLALAAITDYLTPYVEFQPPGGGLSFWLTLRRPAEGTADNSFADMFYATLAERRVAVRPGYMSAAQDNVLPSFRISFAAVPDGRIEKGIEIIANVLREIYIPS